MDAKEKDQKKIEEGMDADFITEAEVNYHLSAWFGALFFYSIRFFKGSFEEVMNKKNHRRNLVVGYFMQLVLVAIIVIVLYKLL